MIEAEVREAICRSFCASLDVRRVGNAFAVSTDIATDAGDRLAFYIEPDGGRFRIVDDGTFLSTLDASKIDLSDGQRAEFVHQIVDPQNIEFDTETFVLRTPLLSEGEIADAAIRFLTASIRLRDVEFWSRDTVRSTFREDVSRAVEARYAPTARVVRGHSIHERLGEFPVDLGLFPHGGGPSIGIHLVNGTEGLTEALAHWSEIQRLDLPDLKIMAVVEDERFSRGAKFQRTLNRIDSVVLYRGDESGVMERIDRIAGLARA